MTSYIKTQWRNSSSPAINEVNLNKIEHGIYDVTEAVIVNTGSISSLNNSSNSYINKDGSVTMDASYIPTLDTDIATLETIRQFRHTVVMDTVSHTKPTRAESITAFKQLPHYKWGKDDAFYIKDTTGAKMISMKYFSDGATDEASAGHFYYRAMTEAT